MVAPTGLNGKGISIAMIDKEGVGFLLDDPTDKADGGFRKLLLPLVAEPRDRFGSREGEKEFVVFAVEEGVFEALEWGQVFEGGGYGQLIREEGGGRAGGEECGQVLGKAVGQIHAGGREPVPGEPSPLLEPGLKVEMLSVGEAISEVAGYPNAVTGTGSGTEKGMERIAAGGDDGGKGVRPGLGDVPADKAGFVAEAGLPDADDKIKYPKFRYISGEEEVKGHPIGSGTDGGEVAEVAFDEFCAGAGRRGRGIKMACPDEGVGGDDKGGTLRGRREDGGVVADPDGRLGVGGSEGMRDFADEADLTPVGDGFVWFLRKRGHGEVLPERRSRIASWWALNNA